MVKKFVFFISLLVVSFSSHGQNGYEVGVELTGARGSNLGGLFGGVLKFSVVPDTSARDQLAYGPSLRYQYFWSNNSYTGIKANGSMLGFGGFVQYRFLEWFYAGAATEIIQNPFNANAKWTPVGFLGGGVHRNFGFVTLNAGLMYDVVDALRDPNTFVSSPLSNNYFLQKKSASNGQSGGYVPLIARVTFYFPIN